MLEYLKKVIRNIKFGNYNKEKFDLYIKKINVNNKKRLHLSCLVVLFINLINFILTFYYSVFSDLVICYCFNIILSIIILGILLVIKKDSKLILFFSYIYMFFLFSNYMLMEVNYNNLSTITVILGLYAIFPMIINDKPLRYILVLSLITFLCCVDTLYFKSSYYSIIDCYNLITFYIVSIIEFYYLFNTRMKEFIKTTRIEMQRDTDYLTKLSNKLITEKNVNEYLKLNGNNLSVMFVVDLDNFKQVNDTYGHLEGDRQLILIAKIFKRLFRKSDYISRIGGDEFVIFVGHINEKKWAIQKAKTIIKEVKKIRINGKQILGCSIGIAFSSPSGNYHQLFMRADKAMYYTKENGKNTYIVYDDMILNQEKK